MSNFFEHEGDPGFEFGPFDDAREGNRYIASAIYGQSGSGMDTSGFDTYRQGVEITIAKYLYGGMVAKIWAGNLNHYIKIETYGQARSWTEYDNLKYHDDELVPFDPTTWITDPEGFHTPLYFNEGPQQEEEAIIEPFTFVFRKDPLVGANPPRSPKASLEDGNMLAGESGNTRVLQFIEYASPLTRRFFLDSGQEYIGANPPDRAIIVEGYVPLIERLGKPFNDTDDEEIVKQLTITELITADTTFLSELKKLSIELDEDIREIYGIRSATAGTTVYGRDAGRYGTDSIAYTNVTRGS